jgi:hypothetical protein
VEVAGSNPTVSVNIMAVCSRCESESKPSNRDVQRCVMVVVARDGIEPPTPTFQGRLASELSGLESEDMVEAISVIPRSI